MDKFTDGTERMLEDIKQREKRYEAFNVPLANELYGIALRTFPEIGLLTEDKRKELYLRAFFRAGELSDFMLARVYDGEEDESVDVNSLRVPARDDLKGGRNELEKRMERMVTEYHEAYKLLFQGLLEFDKPNVDFLYDCFECAKKQLWNNFPEISEFSGNSILRMNEWAYNRMWQFANNVDDILK